MNYIYKNLKISLIQIIFLIIIFFSSTSLRAQYLQWSQNYGSAGDDGGESMVLSNDGGIIITGFISQIAYGYKDVLLMKTNSSGNQVWSRTYNLHLNDFGRSVHSTSDGGYIIAGMTEVSPQVFDPFLIKTDSAGNLQWQQQYDYGFGADDRAHSVMQTADGGYIVAGQTWLMHGSFGNYDIYVFKTDMNGNVLWKKIFFREESGGDVALAVQQLGDKGYIIGGFTQSSSWASYIIRTDSLGNSIWSNIYPGSWQSECYDIQATPDGGFIFTGTESSFETDTDLLLTKLDGNGNLLWKKIYGSIDAEDGRSIKQLPGGGFIVAGMSSHGAGSYDMYIVRTNSNGDSLWSILVGGTGDDRAYSVESPQPGTYYVTGLEWSFGQGMGDIYLIKLTESVTGITENNSVPKSPVLYQNFPNPFNPVTKIKFDIPNNLSFQRKLESSYTTLKIFDILGKEIATLVNQQLLPGTYEVTFDGSNVSSGIYFYKLSSEGFNETKRMMLVK